MSEKIIAFIPAKGNSDRIVGKNRKLLDGKPLFLHTVEKVCEMKIFDKVYIDTDCEKIIKLSREVEGLSVMRRDPKYASNVTNGNQLLMNEINFDPSGTIYVQILCTSPFIKKETIVKAIDVVRDGSQCSTLVKKEHLYFWKNNKPSYDISNIPNSKTIDPVFIETMGLYVIRKDVAISEKKRITINCSFIEASHLESIDLNNPDDFQLAEYIASGIREKNRKFLNNLKANLSSAMLSDILDDLGIVQKLVVTNLKPNIINSKILGYAKTIKLRKKRPNEKIDGIYEALKSYNNIIPGDVIVVENELSEFAYFGELNCNLAIRSGAIGALIGGKTRDSESVKSYNFPVFSEGNTCQDVRGRAVLGDMSCSVVIDDVVVYEGDLIFGDCEGIIVIPKNKINLVLDEAIKKIKSEGDIIFDITKGYNIDSITKKHGFF